jgi:hypothetical protein
MTAFLKRIPLLIQEGFYIKKSGAEKYRGKRVKYDCHNNYRQSSSRAVWEKERNENFCDKGLWTTKREIHASFLCKEDGGRTTADKSKNQARESPCS